MPLKGAPLSAYCQGPASLCEAVNLDCTKCNSIHREPAQTRQRAGLPLWPEEQKKTEQKPSL